MAIFTPYCAILKRLNSRYKNIWLVSERGNDARDNGYWFYKYLKENHPEIQSYFVITKDSPDFSKIEELGGMVEYGSMRHYFLYYCAEKLIGTHVQPCAPDSILYYHLAAKGIKAHKKQIFLQHGITKDEMQWLHRKNFYIDMFVCGAKPEYDYIRSTFGHPEGVAKYTGFCRFDSLINSGKTENMILVMPTWRGSDYPSGKDFLNTQFYKHFSSLLSNEELKKLLKEHDYRLVFYPHIEMQKNLKYFNSDDERVILADKSGYDVQALLKQCRMLITDYSSVFFDVAYLNKPIIYYQFDAKEFREYHYKKGYFDYETNGFGPVCTTEDSLITKIKDIFENNLNPEEEYEKRINDFFILRDTENCERTYQAICSL